MGKLSEATLRSDYNLFPLFMNARRAGANLPSASCQWDRRRDYFVSIGLPMSRLPTHSTEARPTPRNRSAVCTQLLLCSFLSRAGETKETVCHQMKLVKDKFKDQGIFSKMFHESYETS